MKIEKGKRYYCDLDCICDGQEFNRGAVYECKLDGYLQKSNGNSSYIEPEFLRNFVQIIRAGSIQIETRPSHYGGDTNPHEPIKIIQHYGLSFELGNVIKYVLRSDKKGQREADLKKAMQYLQFELNKLNK